MLDRLLSRLAGKADAPQPLQPADARDAMAVILVHAARADGDYDAEEQAQIDRILSSRYALSVQ
ncbi:MAG: TerB family tellurite resistance protein, partial [Pseudomonadota bacterium]